DAGFVAGFDECEESEVNFTRQSAVGEAPPADRPPPPSPPLLSSLPPPPTDLESLPPPPGSVVDRAAATVAELTAGFTERTFLPGARGSVAVGWEALPDVIAVRDLEARSADPVWIRLLLTFGAALDRGRGNSGRWQAVSAAFDADSSLFDPGSVGAL